MLTKEQIENLKENDPLLLVVTLKRKINHCTFKVNTSIDSCVVASSMRLFLPSEHGTSVPTTKHNPTRLFRNGDIVRYVERDGRSYVDAPPVGAICCVCVGEDSVGLVSVEFKFSENEEPAVYDVPFYHLELVTPVEEMEPYLMLANVPSNSIEVRDKRTNKVEATFYFGKDNAYTFEQAATRAEAERDRLNAELRKENQK